MREHGVVSFANGLSAKLATRSRHVCVFLGAGASRACGLPDVAALQSGVLARLGDHRAAFERQLEGRNFEQALSRLRRVAALLENSDDQVDGLTAALAVELDHRVCRYIVEALDPEQASQEPMLKFAAWLARADYQLPVELFTLNYDLLPEKALEALGVPYFDGFTGALRARFRTDLVEADANSDDWLPAFLVRVWKLHGSVHWAWEKSGRSEVVRLGAPVAADDGPAAIYPSDAKYDESRRMPFVVLHDRLRRALHHPETLLLISGYSFGDQHLNEILFDAARRRPRSEFIAACYDEIPDTLAERALVTPNLQALGGREAIIGGVRADWELTDDAPEDLWTKDTFVLGDFAHLAGFLARSSPPRGDFDVRLGELLTSATAKANA